MTTTSRMFYGWWVTAVFSVMVFTSSGVRHAVGPFLKPMVADLHVDRGSFSLVLALGLFLYGVFMPMVGHLVDRVGARWVTGIGGVVLALSLGTILGTIFLVHQTGAAVGSWLAGALFEATGGYGVSFTMACAVLVGAALVSLRIDDGSRRLRWAVRTADA